MKTTCTLFVVLFAFCFNAYPQQKIPAFGDIDLADLKMTSCDIDPDAAAYKLLDIGEVTYPRGRNLFKMNMVRRVRIKILKEKGIDEANVKIPFLTMRNYERITDLAAYTYNLGTDGNVIKTKLSKDAIFTQKVDKRWTTITFTLPDVKPGSVIEYQYTDIQEDPTRLENWRFQDDIPTRYSSYTAVIPSFLKYVNQIMAYQPVVQTKTETDESINTESGTFRYTAVKATYSMEKIPALKSEPFMSSYKDYQQRIEFQLSQIEFGDGHVTNFRTTWAKLSEELLDDADFGEQLRRNLPHTKDLDDKLKGVDDTYSRMMIVHNYVKSNMAWNGQESFYTNAGVKDAWDKRSGSNGEINLILLNLLRDAGVTAYPLLVSTRDNGATNAIYPFLGQFNNVMAYVEIGDNYFVLNAADKYNPSRLIPYDVVNTEALLLSKGHTKWISLANDKQKWKNSVSIIADIDGSGTMKGEAVVYNYDYSRNPKIKKYKEEKTDYKELFSKENTALTIDNVVINNVESDSLPLEQKLNFSSRLNTSGEYKYFTVNLFSGLEKNPFIADNRTTDIDFGYNQAYAIYGNISIPDGFQVEELPKNISMIMPDTSVRLQRFMQLDNNIISFRIMIDFSKPYYTVQEYADFKEFNKKLYSKLNEQIVIKKKNATP